MATETNAPLEARVAELEQEVAALRSQVDDYENGVVRDWLVSSDAYATDVPDVHNTFSWRVTRPLRQVRTVQLKVSEIGFLPTARIVASRVGRRARGGR